MFPDNGGIGLSPEESPTAEDNDDDTEKEGVTPQPDFHWEDSELHQQTLLTLNKMRKNKHFCDVILQVKIITNHYPSLLKVETELLTLY
jgi:hypothetical protein